MALTRPAVAKETAQPTEAAAEVREVVEEKMTQEGVQATAQVADAKQDAPEAEASQEVAVSEPAPAPTVAQAQASAMSNFKETMAQEGFEGLELTGMSFDRIKLHEGKFLLGSEEVELGTEVDCVIYSTRPIYVVRQSTDNDAEAFYSYDEKGATHTDGTSARETLEEWFEDGYGTEDAPLDIRPYLEATAVLVNRDDEYEGEMVMLSVPPASKARLGGAAAQAYNRFKGAKLSEVVTRLTVGKKIGEGQKAFRPWLFKVIGRYEG
jgi:hypothetical protein